MPKPPTCRSCGCIQETCPHCGEPYFKKRSGGHHNLWFAALERVFENWPEGHVFHPEDTEHLRAWMLVRVGHSHPVGPAIPIQEGGEHVVLLVQQMVSELMARLRKEKRYTFLVRRNRHLALLEPKSMSWEEMEQPEFSATIRKIRDEVLVQTGMDFDKVMAELMHEYRTRPPGFSKRSRRAVPKGAPSGQGDERSGPDDRDRPASGG